jgi:broad specificity phosphatase PhoE
VIQRPFIFIRHGETEANVRQLCQGQIDFPLTEKGKQQAVEAAERLKNFTQVNRIFTSTLGRAKETTAIIASATGCMSIIELAGLQERGWGVLEGQPNTGMYAQELRECVPSYVDDGCITGLEPIDAIKKRIIETFENIFQQCPNEIPVIVSHGRLFFVLCSLIGVPAVHQIANGIPLLCSPDGSPQNWKISALENISERCSEDGSMLAQANCITTNGTQ